MSGIDNHPYLATKKLTEFYSILPDRELAKIQDALEVRRARIMKSRSPMCIKCIIFMESYNTLKIYRSRHRNP